MVAGTLSDAELARQKQIDDWLPITSSRNAKWWYSAFHNVTAMVGAGVLSLPFALAELGWGVGGLWSQMERFWDYFCFHYLIDYVQNLIEDSDEAVVGWSETRNPGSGQMVGGCRWSDGRWWSRTGGILVVADCVSVFEREIGRRRGRREEGRRAKRERETQDPALSKTVKHLPKTTPFPSLTLGARLMRLGVRFLRLLRLVLRLLRLCA
ncbi:hypothetical protein ACLB2K_036925 [Fragaria x ananassa]